jgi:hypothetical protein
MDTSYTFAESSGAQIAVYAPPAFQVPEHIVLGDRETGDAVTFYRLSDRPLTCDPVPGVKGRCGSFECHRRELGKCQCGRHPEGVEINRMRDIRGRQER